MRYFIIHGVTVDGKKFRPSDWAQRLASVMARFTSTPATANLIAYSAYVTPTHLNGVNCVVVDHKLRDKHPLAWKFVREFARDNQLTTSESETLPTH